MTKGIVMEKHRQYTVVMTDNGLFLKVKPVGDAAGIGSEVSLELLENQNRHLYFFYSGQKIKHFFRVMIMVCFALLFFLPIYLMSMTKKTYAYVNLDINPNVELEVDNRLYVRSIRPLNHNASMLMKTLSHYKHKPLNETISRILDKSTTFGFEQYGKKAIIGVCYTQKHNISVLDSLRQYLNSKHTDWQMVAFHIPQEIRRQAAAEERSMNEVMAETLEGNQSPEVIKEKEKMNNKEKAIIQSFYHIQQESADKKV